MADPVIFASQRNYMAVAKEAAGAYGTPVTPPTMFWPTMDPKWAPKQTNLVDDALRGNMAATQGMVAGIRYDEVSYSTYCYLDNLAQHMNAILGFPDAVVGTVAPYSHSMSLLDTGSGQPPSYTLYIYNGAEAWQMAGAKLVSLDVEVTPDGLAKLTPSWQGKPAVKVTDPTPTWATTAPMPGWNGTITIATVGTSIYQSAKISLKRNDAGAKWTISGSQAPYEIFVGALEVTGEFKAIYQGNGTSPDDLTGYLVNTQPAITLQLNPVGDTVHYAKWTMTKVGYTSSAVEPDSGSMSVTSQITAIANATDGNTGGVSPIKYTQVDTVATAY